MTAASERAVTEIQSARGQEQCPALARSSSLPGGPSSLGAPPPTWAGCPEDPSSILSLGSAGTKSTLAQPGAVESPKWAPYTRWASVSLVSNKDVVLGQTHGPS